MAENKQTKVEEPAKPETAKPKVDAGKKFKIFPVYRPMHDPMTGITYGEIGVETEMIDPWVQSQLDAGKLRFE